MRKSDKKLDNSIRVELTDICELALKEIEGFLWLTHLVNYDDFPSSLKIICVFDTNFNLSNFTEGIDKKRLSHQIISGIETLGIKLKKMERHIYFDSQENCDAHHNGIWSERFRRVTH
jgi:hypothetical protein